MTVIRPGLCSITHRELSVNAVAALAVSVGLEGIEWGGDVHVKPGDFTAVETAVVACERFGLDIPSYGSYLGTVVPHDPVEVLDTAVALGAENVRVWAGTEGSEQVDSAARARITAEIGDWCDLAADRSLTVGLEYHGGTLTDTVASTRDLLTDLDRPNLFTYWQPRDRGADAGDADLVELDLVADRLSHLHVFWWHDWLTRFPLAEGTPFWSEAFERATRVPCPTGDRWAFLEFVRGDEPEQLTADAATLLDLLR